MHHVWKWTEAQGNLHWREGWELDAETWKYSPHSDEECQVVPELYCNMFSVSAALKEGCYLEGDLKEARMSWDPRKMRGKVTS